MDLCGAEISYKNRSVRAFSCGPVLSLSTLEHFARDVLLPRLVAGDAPLVMHGALLSRGDDAVCLVGESGQGKSTLSAALRNAGWAFHGDDAQVLRPAAAGIAAQAIYPSLRLFPDSLDQLYPEPPAGLARVADYLDKYRLDPQQDLADPARLRAVFVLGGEEPAGEVTVAPLSASKFCMTLISQSFALDPSDREGARGRLLAASAVAAAVSGYDLRYPRDYARLPEVIGWIGDLLAGLPDRPGDKPAGKDL